ncbi:helix-turn-helix transcriptional regulator [Aeromonas sp. R1-2]|uniref:helix-turn-helix transcriptional regulator n=1 Tax=Aeromonas sp. R1-2 TaxID=3138456 RepID=UPI0034A3E0EF
MSLISTTAAAERLGVSRSTIERLRRNPAVKFPRPIYIAPNSVRFDSDELDQYIDSRRNAGGVNA